LFGAVAAAGPLPFAREQFEEAIRRSGVGVEASLAAFRAGAAGHVPPPAAPAKEPRLAARVEQEFPRPCHEILQAGFDRLVDYQDQRYAAEFLDRLAPVRDRDHGGFALLRETARYLALWMSYEDAIRVAGLKARAARFARVRQEARVGPAQLLEVHDYLYPRVGELADILPAGIGRWLLSTAWARRVVELLTRKGKIVQTTSVSGYMKLHLLARMRRSRRRSLRFQTEQRKIGEWLAAVVALAADDYALACEAAECPRLLKGYAETRSRGDASFATLMSALPGLRGTPGAAARFRQLRETALAETGDL
jgi:indolepyruvate ferredoxin oxidoreductase beta subunit